MDLKLKCIFPSQSAKSLGIYRLLLFGFILYFFASSNYLLKWSEVPKELWFSRGLTRYIHILFWDLDHTLLMWLWRVSLIFSCIGLMTRLSMFLAFLLSFYLMGFAQSFGYFTHLYMPIIWLQFFMAFSRAGDDFSVDSLIRKKLNKKIHSINGWEYSWPIFAAQIVFCTIFFQAGLSKIINGGMDWLTGDSMKNYFLYSFIWPFNPRDRVFPNLNMFLINEPIIAQFGALSSMIIELFCPLALFFKRLRWPIVFALLIMQVIIRFTIFVNFTPYLVIYFAWLPFEKFKFSKILFKKNKLFI